MEELPERRTIHRRAAWINALLAVVTALTVLHTWVQSEQDKSINVALQNGVTMLQDIGNRAGSDALLTHNLIQMLRSCDGASEAFETPGCKIDREKYNDAVESHNRTDQQAEKSQVRYTQHVNELANSWDVYELASTFLLLLALILNLIILFINQANFRI